MCFHDGEVRGTQIAPFLSPSLSLQREEEKEMIKRQPRQSSYQDNNNSIILSCIRRNQSECPRHTGDRGTKLLSHLCNFFLYDY